LGLVGGAFVWGGAWSVVIGIGAGRKFGHSTRGRTNEQSNPSSPQSFPSQPPIPKHSSKPLSACLAADDSTRIHAHTRTTTTTTTTYTTTDTARDDDRVRHQGFPESGGDEGAARALSSREVHIRPLPRAVQPLLRLPRHAPSQPRTVRVWGGGGWMGGWVDGCEWVGGVGWMDGWMDG
jgi:hypothetical protein